MAVRLAHLQLQTGLGNPCAGAVVVLATDALGRYPRRAGSSLADCQPPHAVHAEVDLDTGVIHVSWPPTPGAVAYTVRWMDDTQPNPVLLQTTVTEPTFDCTCEPTERALAFHVTVSFRCFRITSSFAVSPSL